MSSVKRSLWTQKFGSVSLRHELREAVVVDAEVRLCVSLRHELREAVFVDAEVRLCVSLRHELREAVAVDAEVRLCLSDAAGHPPQTKSQTRRSFYSL